MPSPQPLTEEEFRKIIDEIMKVKPYCKNVELALFNSWKFATMLWFHYYLGLRPRTVRLIEIKHLDFKNRILFVPAMNVKTRAADNFPIPDVLYVKLIVWLKVRCKLIHNSKWLFPSSKFPFNCQDKNYLGGKVRKILKKLDISRPSWKDKSGMIHYNKCLYSIRRSFATKVWQRTKNIKFVEIALGHHDPLMRNAWRYISICEDEERPEIFRQVWG